ncbi:hypothetical protein BDW59DRAFT_171597 [Aspergillus cavernicola]|uniref:L-ornithine N(5)-monooxygenase n=1 Tax=Aspergillus cavernicola TaxID=176166 RepID=A0ABR4IH33_9EURO
MIPQDILIIGAGPCGLAVAARLKEHTPSAIFTDEEHQRYHWINKHRGKMNLVRSHRGKIGALGVGNNNGVGRNKLSTSESSTLDESSDTTSSSIISTSSTSTSESNPGPSMLVLDSTGKEWLSRWHNAFRTLEITQLRSPMFFHIDPSDRDGMLAYTTETGREGDLWEISGCVGKEVSKYKRKKALAQTSKSTMKMKMKTKADKNKGVIGDTEIDERDRKDYFSPGTGLFRDFCERVVARYGLSGEGLVQAGEVVDIVYDYFDDIDDEKKTFKVSMKDGDVVYARAVVMAIGPGGRKIVPEPFSVPFSGNEAQGACHSSEIRGFPGMNVKKRIAERKETNVVVVGGGLSSAQIVDMAIRKGVKKVWFLMRSDFKVKHFDITLSWMGKFKNYEKAVFWSADTDEERMEMIKTARGGGSITPRYQKILREHTARRRVSIHTRTVITGKEYDSVSKTWRLTTDPPIPDLPEIDYIYFATGMAMNVEELPMLKNMHREYPIETIQGLPCLTDDLMWKAEVPLFLTGRLAGLRLGPGAANLEGARLGAERIAWAMEEVMGKKAFGMEVDKSTECFCGLGNRFAGLDTFD